MQPLNQKELTAVAGGNLEAPLVPEVQIEYNIERFTTFFCLLNHISSIKVPLAESLKIFF